LLCAAKRRENRSISQYLGGNFALRQHLARMGASRNGR
jgi:hypothetical protein